MNQAAVGFQCPSCVREGHRSTRAGRLPYGGTPSADPRLTSIGLIAANALVWLAIMASGAGASRLVDRLALLPVGRCVTPDGSGYFPRVGEAACSGGGVSWVPGVADGAVWQLLTSAFTHVEVMHIGFNMLALWFLGPQLEIVLGRARFLAVYLVSGLAGSAAVMLFAQPASQTLGASGAVFGLMGALLVVGLKIHAPMQQVWLWLGLNLLFTFTVSGISWQGHLGGLAGGAAAAAVLVYAPRSRRTPLQLVAIVVLAAAALAVALLRAAAL